MVVMQYGFSPILFVGIHNPFLKYRGSLKSLHGIRGVSYKLINSSSSVSLLFSIWKKIFDTRCVQRCIYSSIKFFAVSFDFFFAAVTINSLVV